MSQWYYDNSALPVISWGFVVWCQLPSASFVCCLLFYTVCIVFIHIAYQTMAQLKGKLPTNNRGDTILLIQFRITLFSGKNIRCLYDSTYTSSYNRSFYVISYKIPTYTILLIRFRITLFSGKNNMLDAWISCTTNLLVGIGNTMIFVWISIYKFIRNKPVYELVL